MHMEIYRTMGKMKKCANLKNDHIMCFRISLIKSVDFITDHS